MGREEKDIDETEEDLRHLREGGGGEAPRVHRDLEDGIRRKKRNYRRTFRNEDENRGLGGDEL